MKEATGELNASLVVMIIVALLAAFFFMVIWPGIKGNMNRQAKCAGAVCSEGYNDDGMAECHNPHDAGNTFTCPYRG